jgi:hypothetical protein
MAHHIWEDLKITIKRLITLFIKLINLNIKTCNQQLTDRPHINTFLFKTNPILT